MFAFDARRKPAAALRRFEWPLSVLV